MHFWHVLESIFFWAIFDDKTGEILTFLGKMQAANRSNAKKKI